MLKETLRSRWFSAALHGGLWLMLLLAVVGIGGRRPQFGEADPGSASVQPPVPVAKMEGLFSPDNWPKQVVDPASQNSFATMYFTPPVVPVPVPTTRRLEITYQGFYLTAGGPTRAMLRAGDQLVSVPLGGLVVSNLWVADAVFQTLTLTNSAGQTNLVALNVKKEVEVPLK